MIRALLADLPAATQRPVDLDQALGFAEGRIPEIKANYLGI